MKAISLWQPWASLIANGAKKIETRSWPTNYRGPILIHAAKRKNKGEMKLIADHPNFCAALGIPLGQGLDHLNNLPYGAIIALADLTKCERVETIPWGALDIEHESEFDGSTYTERFLGNYEPGRFGWLLENVAALDEPIPYKGEQGLFEVPGLVIAQIAFSNAIAKELSPL